MTGAPPPSTFIRSGTLLTELEGGRNALKMVHVELCITFLTHSLSLRNSQLKYMRNTLKLQETNKSNLAKNIP